MACRRTERIDTLASSPLLPGDLDQFAAALLGELREHDADDRAVVGRVDAEIGVADRLLDRAELRGVVGLDDRHPRLGDVHRRHLRDRRRRAVVVDDQPGEAVRRWPVRCAGRRARRARRAPPSPSSPRPRRASRRSRPASPSAQPVALTSVPIFSPRTTRAMLPSARSNTMIGMPLSRHRLNAVASATFRPAPQHLVVADRVEPDRVRMRPRVGVVHAVDTALAHQQHLAADLQRALGGDRVGGEVRHARRPPRRSRRGPSPGAARPAAGCRARRPGPS